MIGAGHKGTVNSSSTRAAIVDDSMAGGLYVAKTAVSKHQRKIKTSAPNRETHLLFAVHS